MKLTPKSDTSVALEPIIVLTYNNLYIPYHINNNLLSLLQNLKVYRHPSIVKYVDFISCSPGTGGGDYLITEKTTPLTLVIDQQSDLQIRLGLHDVIIALKFLHEVKYCHLGQPDLWVG